MKKEEVPQDESNLASKNMRELYYATDKEGNYTTELSTGWEPKTIALSNSIQEIQERIDLAKQQVLDGKVSPLVYYMELHRMDPGILAGYMDMWVWRVKRHFKPGVFNTLKSGTLKKYADIFEISPEQLKNFKAD